MSFCHCCVQGVRDWQVPEDRRNPIQRRASTGSSEANLANLRQQKSGEMTRRGSSHKVCHPGNSCSICFVGSSGSACGIMLCKKTVDSRDVVPAGKRGKFCTQAPLTHNKIT